MTKIIIHGQKMQFHKIPKCRVSFMTGSGAFSIYDNGVPVDGTSIEVPVGTTLSYDGWVQGVSFAFSIGNKSYAVYERNGYSGTKKYLEGITIDGTAFTKGTHTITGNTEINAFGVRDGISITFTLSPQPTPTPPPAPILYPSGVSVYKVTLNNDGYAAIISFDEGESILVPEQQGYEATGASVSDGTALSADTIITVYLQSLVTCALVPYSQAQIQDPSEISERVQYALHQNYPSLQFQQWRSPSKFSYIFYDGTNRYGIGLAMCGYPGQNPGEIRNGETVIPFFYDGYNVYSTPFDYQGWAMGQLPYWQDTGYSLDPYLLDMIFYQGDTNAVQSLVSQWNASDICDLGTKIYNLATNK